MATMDTARARIGMHAKFHHDPTRVESSSHILFSSLPISVLRSCTNATMIRTIGRNSPALSESGTRAPARIATEDPLDELNRPLDSLHMPRTIKTGSNPSPSAWALLISMLPMSRNTPPWLLAIAAEMNHATTIAQYVDRTTQSLA